MKKINKILLEKALIVLLIIFFAPTIGFSGVKKTYYKSGAVLAEATYMKGKLEGPYREYYESGALKKQLTYKNDKAEGPGKRYYENGTLKLEATYKKDKGEGP